MILSSRQRRILLALVLILVILLVGRWFWPDARAARAKQLQAELFSPEARNLSPEQRQARWREFREVTKALSPEQRRQLMAEGRKRKQAEIGRYFRMSPQEKTRYLDEQINRMERIRQNGKARAGGPPGGARARGASSGSNRSPQQRDQRRQQFLDSSTAAERAQMNAFMRDLNARRTQRGLGSGGRGPMR
jgi:hypothetical protein